jgi:hypothetical protein
MISFLQALRGRRNIANIYFQRPVLDFCVIHVLPNVGLDRDVSQLKVCWIIVLVSPEQLQSPAFEGVLKEGVFMAILQLALKIRADLFYTTPNVSHEHWSIWTI